MNQLFAINPKKLKEKLSYSDFIGLEDMLSCLEPIEKPYGISESDVKDEANLIITEDLTRKLSIAQSSLEKIANDKIGTKYALISPKHVALKALQEIWG